MSRPDVVIERGLPDDQRAAAATIFNEAFAENLRLAIPGEQERLAFLEQAFKAENLLIALCDDELMGLAGLSSHNGAYVGGSVDRSMSWRSLRDQLGAAGAVRAAIGLEFGAHKPEPGELYIDGIAVAATARGLGIGTMLLAETAAIASRESFRWVRLEVVDTNPRAQQLYERVGYRVTKVDRFPYLRWLLGFGGSVTMELDASGDAPGREPT